ncbi:MAG TPA: DUF2079 domain-containing protein [Candidatus Cybelea sp.]|nr:DUF2079 domain-containing protein [Candidatus Cybelea sp.]
MRDRILWLGCLLYAALFTYLGWVKYGAHRNLVDFGIFAQTVASASGCFCNPIEGSHWAFHFSPVLYPVGVVVALVHSPVTLIALQAMAGALVAPPVYALVLRTSNDAGAAWLCAVVTWLYPPLAGVIFGDFHENGFAPAAVAWTFYAFDAGLTVWTFIGALVTLAIKEDQAIFLAIAGTLGAWRFHGTTRGRVAAAIAVIAALVGIAFFFYIQPHAAAHAAAGWQPERFYAWTVNDAPRIAGGIGARLGFLLLAFVPLLFLPLRSRMIWLTLAPIAEVLLSRMPTTYTMGTHYAGAWIGYVLVAFAFGVRSMEPRRVRVALGACIALCAVEFAVADPLHPGLNLRAVQARDLMLDRFLETLPADLSVATQEEAYTHLALFDPYAGLLPESAQQQTSACFALVDRDFPDSARLQEYGDVLMRLVQARRYVLLERAAGIELYRSCASASPARAGQPRSARTIR